MTAPFDDELEAIQQAIATLDKDTEAEKMPSIDVDDEDDDIMAFLAAFQEREGEEKKGGDKEEENKPVGNANQEDRDAEEGKGERENLRAKCGLCKRASGLRYRIQDTL